MFVRHIAVPLVLAFVLLFARSAQAFFDPPWITPENPLVGEAVAVNLRGGICDSIGEREGYPQITQQGNAIRLVEYGAHLPSGDPLCIFGNWTFARPIGSYPPGDYTVTVDLAYIHPVFGLTILNIGVVSFTVVAPTVPIAAPVNSIWNMAVLLFALVMAAFYALRKHRPFLVILALACTSNDLIAQERNIQVLLSNAPGAPTPAHVMAWVNSSPRSSASPLQAFNVKSPLAAGYLVADRASGDFLAWLDANPHSARKKLEDILLLAFMESDLPAALAALQADPNVAQAGMAPEYKPSSVELVDFEITPGGPLGGNDQYGWFDMNLDAAGRLAGGYGLVGQIDIGLYRDHPALRQFSDNTYVGGNFVPEASRDVGLTGRPASDHEGFDPANVDEKKAMWIGAGNCTTARALLQPAFLGHGTHVAGLLAANGASGLDIQGTCKHCGIAMWKMSYLECFLVEGAFRTIPWTNWDAVDRARTETIDIGTQVLSMSFGRSSDGGVYDCKIAYRSYPMCLAIDYAAGRDVAQVAASGNEKKELQFPASDKRVISAGGFIETQAFWDDAPNCPPTPNSSQCGSNYSKQGSNGTYRTRQELLGSAKHALSTAYPNTTHANYAQCGDGYGTPMGDGIGWCTGTSMSTPQIAGVVGLLRSINPLVPTGNPEPAAGEKAGLRTVLKQTASRAGAWDPKLGYGIPDAAAAARKVLGTAVGATVRNRATPLFRLWQATTKDFAETSSPQYALSLMINQDKKYVQPASGTGKQPPVPGYAFPYDTDDPTDPNDTFDTTPPAAPRAAIYVLTTEYRSRSEWPNLIPLHLMDKDYPGGKDYLLATTKAEIESAYLGPDHVHCNNGHLDNDPTSTCAGDDYDLRTIQGYIYAPCTPEPTCIPPGAVKLWRHYRAADDDCAVFLDGEKSAFAAAGYTAACPISSTTMIGYAYPATDADGNGVIDVDTDHDQDGLIDGFEYVVGTNPNAADSDGDGIPDASEFPLAGLATGDPCLGGSLGARNCGADIIFRNGFNP